MRFRESTGTSLKISIFFRLAAGSCKRASLMKEAGFPRTPSGKNFYMLAVG
jgi:hypothetical protein